MAKTLSIAQSRRTNVCPQIKSNRKSRKEERKMKGHQETKQRRREDEEEKEEEECPLVVSE